MLEWVAISFSFLAYGLGQTDLCLFKHHFFIYTMQIEILEDKIRHIWNSHFKPWLHIEIGELCCCCSVLTDSVRPHGLQRASHPCSFTVSWRLLKLMSIELVMPSNCLILCHPFFLLPSSIFPSIRIFFNESAFHIRWLKYWRFSLSISLSNE